MPKVRNLPRSSSVVFVVDLVVVEYIFPQSNKVWALINVREFLGMVVKFQFYYQMNELTFNRPEVIRNR